MKVTQGIDVRKIALHYVVRAWKEDATGYTIDYGVENIHGTVAGSDEGVDLAIIRALHGRAQMMIDEPCVDEDGNPVPIELTLIDAGWRTEAIYSFCRETGGLRFRPAKGFGKSSGCIQTSFTPVVRNSLDKKVGDRWFLARRQAGLWEVCMDADHWKAWEHDRWMTPPDQRGTLFLWGDRSEVPGRLSEDQKSHMTYSKHLTAEKEVEEIVKGRMVRKWKSKSDTNHYFDASYMANVAASMLGIRLLKTTPVAATSGLTVSQWIAAQR